MKEAINTGEILDPKVVNPLEIGAELTSKRKRLRNPFAKPTLTESERRDLKKIDSGTLTLEDIKMYAANHLYYFTSWGEVQYKGSVKKEFEDAKMLVRLLDQEKYEQAAGYFLQQARAEWRGPESNNQPDEWGMVLASGEDMANVPQAVIEQGERAIREYMKAHPNSKRFVTASTTSAMYLKQAAVLARLI